MLYSIHLCTTDFCEAKLYSMGYLMSFVWATILEWIYLSQELIKSAKNDLLYVGCWLWLTLDWPSKTLMHYLNSLMNVTI